MLSSLPVRNEELPASSVILSIVHSLIKTLSGSPLLSLQAFSSALISKMLAFSMVKIKDIYFFLSPTFLCFLTHSYSSDCEQSPHTVKSLSCFSDPCNLPIRQD